MLRATTCASLWMAASIVASTANGQVMHRNLAELTSLAPDIVVGRVVEVAEGTRHNLPYTAVTLDLTTTLKGKLGGTYTFRQFGYQSPRTTGAGQTNLMVAPAGWPRYREGQEVMLFLYEIASATGLRTTVGLNQGTFAIREGTIVNGTNNLGLFDRVQLPAARALRAREAIPGAKGGPVDAAQFISLVETAVREGWFETMASGANP